MCILARSHHHSRPGPRNLNPELWTLPTVTPIGTELIRNETRLREAWGDDIPTWSDSVRESAGRAVERAVALAAGAVVPAGGWDRGLSPGWLPVLASAYRQTRDERYAAAARAIYERGMAQAEEEQGKGRHDPLVISHRLGDTEVLGWFGALPEFVGSAALDEPALARIVESARRQLNDSVEHLHEARNIRMTQCDALFTQGERLAFLHDAARWRDAGLRAINDAFHRHFNRDGSSVEATGWYHYICMNMQFRYLRLAHRRPELGLQVTPEQAAAALEYLVALVQPDGLFSLIGDCTSAVHPHATLAAVLELRQRLRRELGLDEADPPAIRCFSDARQVMMRDGWGPEATYVTFDATRRSGYHWHPSRNSIQLHFAGRRVIADPGRMKYLATPQRAYACSTRGHSTVNLNGLNQSSVEASVRLDQAEGTAIVQGLYGGGYWEPTMHGYAAGIYGDHHRTLVWVQGRFLLVLDNLYHTSEDGWKPRAECAWQFGPGTVRVDEARREVRSEHGPAALRMLVPLAPEGSRFTLHEGEMDPCRGWVANRGDDPEPAPLLRVGVDRLDPWSADWATVLVPHRVGEDPGPVVGEVVDPAKTGHGKIRLDWPDGSVDAIWWTRRLQFALDRAPDMRSDSGLVHMHRRAGGAGGSVLMVEGSYAEPFAARSNAPRSTRIAEWKA